jgi:hypothetical protein
VVVVVVVVVVGQVKMFVKKILVTEKRPACKGLSI